jgi:hypothetical protein
MTGNEMLTLGISILSLCISILAAYKTYLLGEYQLRLTSRNEFQKLQIDVNKVLIEYPELWAIYDSHAMSSHGLNDAKEKAKLEAFAHMIFNVFESVFVFYGDSPRLTKAEREHVEAWRGFLRDFLNESSFARELLSKPASRIMYNVRFIAEVETALKTINRNKLVPNNPASVEGRSENRLSNTKPEIKA